VSIKIMTAVFERWHTGAGEMLLALALADHAHDDGTRIYPGVKALAEKTRQSVRTVQYQLRRFEEMGWLMPVGHNNGGRSMTSEYRISPEWIKGADIAPISKASKWDDLGAAKGADIASFESEKGADIAPIESEKGATDDTKGCKPEHKRVQPVAPANNRHRTIKESSGGARMRASRRCPATFVVTDEMRAWAAVEVPLVDVERATAMMLDHEFASPRSDWMATWRNWLRAEKPPRNANGQPLSYAQQDERARRRRWEEMTGRKWPESGGVAVIEVMPTTLELSQ
jgi:hypothetical protein